MRIQSWEHGEVYGTVAEISDTPVPSSNNPYYSSGNQNVSFYTMLIALDADSPAAARTSGSTSTLTLRRRPARMPCCIEITLHPAG